MIDIENKVTYKKLFAQITKLYTENKLVEEKQRAQGEYFNIFNILKLGSQEVRLHSAFIAELLNPKGSHGASYLFLQAFLDTLGIERDFIDYNLCSLDITERYIGPIKETEGGRLDIIIEDGTHAIIIENKIYAEDQKNQLLRYHNYGKQKFPKGFKLYYLTLDGHVPQDISLGGNNFEYQNISYEEDIIEWLEKCYKISKDKFLSNAVIKQYCELVKQLTYKDTDMLYNDLLKSIMLAPENILAVGEILKFQDEWEESIIEEYIWKPLAEFANSKGLRFRFEKDNTHGDAGARIYKEEWKYYALFVWREHKKYWNNMHVGISFFEIPHKQYKIYKKDQTQLTCLTESPNGNWPYGWEYLPLEIRNWNYHITEDIVNGKVLSYIKSKFEEMLLEIETRNLKMC